MNIFIISEIVYKQKWIMFSYGFSYIYVENLIYFYNFELRNIPIVKYRTNILSTRNVFMDLCLQQMSTANVIY